jgi:methylated-DNA-[protein]-cysteine S-methyltransferase
MQSLSTYTDYMASPLGLIRIDVSGKAITKIAFIDKKDLPSSSCSLIKECQKELTEYFKGIRKIFSLPLNYKGTDFQNAVWSALKNINFGETTSYTNIASMVQRPLAIRAAGGALNKNPIAIIVPCHRIVSKNGYLTGYAGGLERKSWLIAHENYHNNKS